MDKPDEMLETIEEGLKAINGMTVKPDMASLGMSPALSKRLSADKEGADTRTSMESMHGSETEQALVTPEEDAAMDLFADDVLMNAIDKIWNKL